MNISAFYQGHMYDGEEYMRKYMRRRRGQEYLNVIDVEASKRGITQKQLITILLDVIAKDNLFAAILDR